MTAVPSTTSADRYARTPCPWPASGGWYSRRHVPENDAFDRPPGRLGGPVTSLIELLTTYAFIGQERQERLGDWVGNDGDFAMDFPSRRIEWSSGPVARCDLLGSEAGGTWLWAWANTSLPFGSEVLSAANTLRQRGTELDVPELTERGFPVDDVRNGHVLGTVASGLLGGNGYYFGHGETSAVLTLVTAPELALRPADAIVLSGIITRSLGVFPVPHRPATRAYLDQRGAQVAVADDGSWQVHAPAGGQLTLTFDHLDRVSAVSLEQGPAQGRLTPPPRRGGLFRRPKR